MEVLVGSCCGRSLYLTGFLLLFLFGCTWLGLGEEADYKRSAEKQLWPSDQGFPDRDIVFVMPQEEGVLGFIRPDGSGLITRTIAVDFHAALPTWSPDGQYIAFRTRYGRDTSYYATRHPRVVSAEGRTVGWCYRELGLGWGRAWVTSDNQIVAQFAYGDAENQPDQINLIDFGSCEFLSTLFEASSVRGEWLTDGTLSSQGWLAVSRSVLKNRWPVAADIIVVEPGSETAQVVGYGVAPAWSRDGEWLAFTGSDGIYILRKDGSQLRRVVDLNVDPDEQGDYVWSDEVSVSSWSPDGKWLVYDQGTPGEWAIIYRVNVVTGEVVEVFQGGIHPNWRWDLGVDTE